MNDHYSAISIFVLAFVVSAAAGIAALLRKSNEVKRISLITAGLNSGLLGLAISLLWYQKFQDNLYSLIGICVLSGLTGAAGLDFVLNMIQKGGFSIKLGDKENPFGKDQSEDKK
jgi:hypothetical protein